MKIKSLTTPLIFFALSFLLILISQLLSKNILSLNVFADSSDGITACMYDKTNYDQPALTNCYSLYETGFENSCEGIISKRTSCLSDCETDYSSNIVSGMTCSDVCTALASDMTSQDAQCAFDFKNEFGYLTDYISGEPCPDIYNSCNQSETETNIQAASKTAYNCTNYSKDGFDNLVCGDPPLTNPLNETCKTNCGNFGFTQIECYSICTRASESASTSVCNTINEYDYASSKNCTSATNRTEVLDTDTTPPTLTSWYGSDTVSSATYDAWGDYSDDSGIDYIEYSLDGGTNWSPCDIANGTQYVCHATLSSGENSLTIRGADLIGNINTEANWLSNTIIYTAPPAPDTTAPTVTLNYSLSGTQINSLDNSLKITGAASDTENNVSNVEAFNGSTWQTCTIDSGQNTHSVTFSCTVTGILNGTRVRVRAQDASINANVTSQINQPYVDLNINSSPTNNILANIGLAGISDYVDSTTHLSSPAITGALLNATRLQADDSVSFDGNTKLVYQDPAKNFDFNGTDTSFTVQGWVKVPENLGASDRVLVQKVKDNANHDILWQFGVTTSHRVFAEFNGTEFVTTDRSTSITNTQIIADTWTFVKMSWDAPNKTLAVRVGSNPSNMIVKRLSQDFAVSADAIVIGGALNSNTYNFLGDVSGLQIKNTGDSSSPYVEISTNYSNRERITVSNPTFNIHIEDTNIITSAEYYVSPTSYDVDINTRNWQTIPLPNGESWNTTEKNISLTVDTLADRSWYLLVRTTDEFGNKSLYTNDWITAYGISTKSALASYRFYTETVDSTPPDIFAHTVVPNRTTDKNPTIRGYVRDYKILNEGDTASNINSISISINGGEWQSVQPLDGSFNSPSEEFNFQLNNLSAGTYTYEIKATDASGNTTGLGYLGSDHPTVTGTFEIMNPISVSSFESIVREVNFSTRDLQDPIYTNAIWGNGIARLRQTISFSSEKKIDNLNGSFGYEYGDTTINLQPATDGNLWIVTNTDKLIYYNKATGVSTDYSYNLFKPGSTDKPENLKEFSIGSSRYIVVNYGGTSSSVICHLNDNPQLLTGLTCIDYTNKTEMTVPGYQHLFVFGIDTATAGHTGLYGAVNGAGTDISFVYIDTHNDPMNVEGYTFRPWGKADGIDRPGHLNSSGDPGDPVNPSIISLYFDQATRRIVVSSYNHGTFLCNDGGSPLTNANSSCISPTENLLPSDTYYSFYAIDMDDQGRFWLGGDQGLFMLDPVGLTNTNLDQFKEIIASSDIADEEISGVKWVKGTYPVGDEIFYVTRSGHMRAIETNNTPLDFKDDTNYDYQLPLPSTRLGNSSSWVMDTSNSAWQLSQGRGLYKINLTRSFEDQNIIEFLPTPPEGMLEINNITLSEVNGSVSQDSSHTFNQLVSYQVSNDDGFTWLPINVGETVKFSQPGYKLKVRIIFSKGSTPILDSIKLNYFAYPDAETRVEVENSSQNSNNSNTSSNNTSSSNATSAPTCNDQSPTKPPRIFAALAAGSGQVRLFFIDAGNPYDHFSLQFGTSPNSTQYGATDIGGRNTYNYLVRYLKPGTTYYFRVRAANGCNASAWSNEVKVRAPFFGSASGTELISAQKPFVQYDTKKQTIKNTPDNSLNAAPSIVPKTDSPTRESVKNQTQTQVKVTFFEGVKNFFSGLFHRTL